MHTKPFEPSPYLDAFQSSLVVLAIRADAAKPPQQHSSTYICLTVFAAELHSTVVHIFVLHAVPAAELHSTAVHIFFSQLSMQNFTAPQYIYLSHSYRCRTSQHRSTYICLKVLDAELHSTAVHISCLSQKSFCNSMERSVILS